MRLRDRSQRSWLASGASLFLGTLALSYAFDVIPVGDGDVLESRVPDFVWGLLFLRLSVRRIANRESGP